MLEVLQGRRSSSAKRWAGSEHLVGATFIQLTLLFIILRVKTLSLQL